MNNTYCLNLKLAVPAISYVIKDIYKKADDIFNDYLITINMDRRWFEYLYDHPTFDRLLIEQNKLWRGVRYIDSVIYDGIRIIFDDSKSSTCDITIHVKDEKFHFGVIELEEKQFES